MILTKDKELAQRCRLLRAHGWDRDNLASSANNYSDLDSRYKFVSWGFNLRPTEIQAAFGLEQIKKIDSFQMLRDQNAKILDECVAKNKKFLSTMQISNNVKCSWFAFPIIVSAEAPFSRVELVKYLDQNGIETRPVVAGNLANQPAIQKYPEVYFESLHGADFIHKQGIYIGIHPTTDKRKLEKVTNTLDNFCKQW
jgi:CDP-6-deoxy-D-xylo-4-hexulose-3-dehydrase